MNAHNTQVFALGQRVYSRAGQAAQFLMYVSQQFSGGRIVVQPLYHGVDDQNEWLGGVETWHEAFTEPPRHVYDEEIKILAAKADAIRGEVAELVLQKAELEKRRTDAVKEAMAAVRRANDELLKAFAVLEKVQKTEPDGKATGGAA